MAGSYGGQGEFKLVDYCPAPDYDPELTALVERLIAETVGKENLAAPCGGGGVENPWPCNHRR